MADCDVEKLIQKPFTSPDFVIDGVHFGRGNSYEDKTGSSKLKHKTTEVKCWKIVDEELEEIKEELINQFSNCETYIVEWKSVTETIRDNELLNKSENKIYFYWKGEEGSKGYSPLPRSIEKDNPPVERIAQWAEPPAFLSLFSGSFIVHLGKYNKNSEPHLYILRGEIENELHLYEIEPKKENLRSRTCFVLHFPSDKSCIIWQGAESNSHSKNSIKLITERLFGKNYIELSEGFENEKFLNSLVDDENEDLVPPSSKTIDYTPRLFYLNKIAGFFAVSEIESAHKSEFLTPFPFLQSHLYSAERPAIFLLDDNDEIWLWYGWHEGQEEEGFKSDCFETAIKYAKQKSKITKKLVKLQKVVAGFEPDSFTKLFPVWKKRDVERIRAKAGVLANANNEDESLVFFGNHTE